VSIVLSYSRILTPPFKVVVKNFMETADARFLFAQIGILIITGMKAFPSCWRSRKTDS